jgi:hypothetical protein
MSKQNRTIAIMLGASAALATIILMTAAHADDHVIRPNCWDENVNGEVHRHCAVHRPQAAAAPSQPSVQESPPVTTPNPPVAAPTYPPPPYYGAPPMRAWPTQACAYGPPPCPVYYDRGPAPLVPPPYYGPPPYPYYPGPLFAFGFGPFRFWVP